MRCRSRAALLAGLLVSAFVGTGIYFARIDHMPPPSLFVTARYSGAPVFRPAPTYPKGLIDVNRADEKTLDTLPGIGKVIAARIVEERPYHYLEDLMHVKGIGDKRLAAMRALIAVYGEEED